MEGHGRMFLLPLTREEEVHWWSGYMGKDGQSYHNHHHSALTTPTTSTKTIKRLTREDGKSKQGGNIWVSSPETKV